MASISAIQEDIIEEFAVLSEDMEFTLYHLIDQGKLLPTFSPEEMRDEYLVQGCQAKVWIRSIAEKDRLYYRAQSDAAVTRGLVGLLVRIFSGHLALDILRAELFFPARIGMSRFVGTKRSGGFAMMCSEIKKQAQAFSSSKL